MSSKKPMYGKAVRSSSKQSVSNPVQVRKRFSSLCTPPNNQEQCVFCQKFRLTRVETYAPLLNRALFSKYSSSQNYYYSKDINDIIDNESTSAVVFFRDLECIIEDEEYLKRSYARKEGSTKFKALLEYYKYHKDIPRLFMQKVYVTINKFHEKKRRIEYAAIKRKLNIPDEDTTAPKKKEKKKQKHSDEDMSVGKLKHILRDLNLESHSYYTRKADVSSSQLLHQFVQMVGKRYDYLGQISEMLSITQSQSYFGNDVSNIVVPQPSYVATQRKQYIPPKSKQLVDSKLTKQMSSQQFSQQLLSSHASFERLNLNNLNKLNSNQEQQSQRGETTKRSEMNMGSPFRNQPQSKRVIDGFTAFVQKQQQQMRQANNSKGNAESKKVAEHSRKISANFNSSECQLRLPSRQNSIRQAADLQNYQVNFLKNRVASQMQHYEDDNGISPTKLGLATDRTVKSGKKAPSIQTVTRQGQAILKSTKQMNSKIAQYAVATLKNLQIKQVEKESKVAQKPLVRSSPKQIHFRTKSTDTAQTYKTSPPKVLVPQGVAGARNDSNPKDPLRFTSNIFVQGSGKKSVYNINQNNIVNIYIDDLKHSGKTLQKQGSQTARMGSPPRNNANGTNIRQVYEVYNTHRPHQSPSNCKKKA